MKKLAKVIGITSLFIFLILAIVTVLGFAYKDKVHVMVLRAAEEKMNARISIDNTRINPFSSWPRINVELINCALVPIQAGKYSDRPLIKSDKLQLEFDFWSLLSGKYEIKGLVLISPNFFFYKDGVGIWNVERLLKKNDSGVKSAFTLALQKLKIKDGVIEVLQENPHEQLILKHIDLNSSGTFGSEGIDMDNEVQMTIWKFPNESIQNLNQLEVGSVFKFQSDFKDQNKVVMKGGRLTLGKLELELNGTSEIKKEGVHLDVNFTSLESEFEDLISLYPSLRHIMGEDLSYEGNFSTKGKLKGFLSENRSPDIAIDFEVNKGSIESSGADATLSEITLSGSYERNNDPEKSFVSLEKFSGKLGSELVIGRMLYSNMRTPVLDAELNGRIDLSLIHKIFPGLLGEMESSGKILSQARIKGPMKSLMNNDFKNIEADGNLRLEGIELRHPGLLYPLKDLRGEFTLTQGGFKIAELRGVIGKSDFQLSGNMDNLVPYFLDSTENFQAKLKINSDSWVMEDFLSQQNGKSGGEISFHTDPRIDVKLDFKIKDFRMGNLHGKQVNGTASLINQNLILHQCKLDIFDGVASLEGKLVLDKASKAPLDLDLKWKRLDINTTFSKLSQWGDFALVEDHMYGTFSGEVILQADLLPDFSIAPSSIKAIGKVDITEGKLEKYQPLYALSGFVKLDKLKNIVFEDISTTFAIADEKVLIPDLKLEAFDYKLEIKGEHGFDQTLNYHLVIELPKIMASKSSSSKVKDLIEEEKGEEIKIRLPLSISGNVDEPVFKWDKGVAKKSLVKSFQKEKKELKDNYKKEVEELFGEQDSSKVEDLIEVEEDPNDKPLFPNFKLPFGKKKKKKSD